MLQVKVAITIYVENSFLRKKILKLLKQLIAAKKISPPDWLSDNMLYANVHGSELYGCNIDSSDKDIYGVCLPPKSTLFPHTTGWINGFTAPESFEQWQQHHVDQYDFQVFNITKFLRLALDGNPSVTECLFAPQDCVLHRTASFQLILDAKQEFLTLKSVPRFRGYMLSQLHKIKTKVPEGKRLESFNKWGYDLKFASHTIRLGYYCEQILQDRWIDLRRDAEMIKRIKLGQLSLLEVENLAQTILKRIEKKLVSTTLPTKPNEQKIKQLLINIIECHYGSIGGLIKISESEDAKKLAEIRSILWK